MKRGEPQSLRGDLHSTFSHISFCSVAFQHKNSFCLFLDLQFWKLCFHPRTAGGPLKETSKFPIKDGFCGGFRLTASSLARSV